MEALSDNTITIGESTFVKLTAETVDVVDSQGKQLVWDSQSGSIYYINNGTPESSSMTITDETPSENP